MATPPSSPSSASLPPPSNSTPPSLAPPVPTGSPSNSTIPPSPTPSAPSQSPPPPSQPPPALPPPSSDTPPPPYHSAPPSSSPPPPPKRPPHSPPPPRSPSAPTNSSGGTTPRWSPPVPPSKGNLAPPGGSNRNASPEGGAKEVTNLAVGIGTAAAVVVLFIVIAACITRKKRVAGYRGDYIVPTPNGSSQISGSPNSMGSSTPLVKVTSGSIGLPYLSSDPGLGSTKSWFSYEELVDVTNGFSPEHLLGQGGFGCVYKGNLSDGREVAVKQLKTGGSQGEREFQAEVEIISRVHHRHLVSLVGYCMEETQRLLVYDYVPNRTLYYHLHGRGRPVMEWSTRVKVAAGAARGLAYLHEDCHPRIIHRDIKSSNILLDKNFEALVSDFGLAKLSADTNTHVSTRVMGTFGYLAPEYASTGKLTDKSDVFSFGVVILELITGRKPVDASRTLGDESLVEWARPLMIHALETGNAEGLPDPRLENNYNAREMFRMIEAASACVRYNASMRPRMGHVMRVLDSLVDDLDLNNGVSPGQTRPFSAQPSSEDMRNFQKMAFGSTDYSSDFQRESRNQKHL